jgi:hypothetical protein
MLEAKLIGFLLEELFGAVVTVHARPLSPLFLSLFIIRFSLSCVQRVALGLHDKGLSTLKNLQISLKELAPSQIRQSLVVLIQHNLVEYIKPNESNLCLYTINSNAILERLHYPRYLLLAKKRFGREVCARSLRVRTVREQCARDAEAPGRSAA